MLPDYSHSIAAIAERASRPMVEAIRKANRNQLSRVLDDARELGILPARSDDPARAINSHSASGRRA